MDHYPEINVSERECPSHQTSASTSTSSISSKPTMHNHSQHHHHYHHHQQNKKLKTSNAHTPQYVSFPTPDPEPRERNDSVHDDTTQPIKQDNIEAQLSRFVDAPPPYAEKQYEGKSEDERARMRLVSYAREVSRIMGRQLARGIKGGDGEKGKAK